MKKIVFILCCTLLLQSCDTFWDIILAITEFGTPYEETRRGKEEKEEREQAQWRLEALRLAEEQEQERQREEQRRNDEAPESITGAGFGCVEGDESHNDPISGHIGLEKSLYWLSRSFSIVSGLGISYQGVKYTEPEYSGTLRLSYISIPVLFNYQSERQIYGEIGLQPGFLLMNMRNIFWYKVCCKEFTIFNVYIAAVIWITNPVVRDIC